MTDVLHYQTNDGGDVTFAGGEPLMTDGPETAVYLSLFGGNYFDGGIEADDPLQWWGNVEEPDAARCYRSETQHLISSLPAIPANLLRVEDAVRRDLEWMISSGVATRFECAASMPRLNWILIRVALEIDGKVLPVNLAEQWGVTA